MRAALPGASATGTKNVRTCAAPVAGVAPVSSTPSSATPTTAAIRAARPDQAVGAVGGVRNGTPGCSQPPGPASRPAAHAGLDSSFPPPHGRAAHVTPKVHPEAEE